MFYIHTLKFYNWNLILIILFLSILPCFVYCETKVYILETGEVESYTPQRQGIGFFQRDLAIYCYHGKNKTLGSFFQTIQFQLDIDNDDFTQYEGATPEIVKLHQEEQNSMFSINLFSYKKKTRLRLNPFNHTCIGIDTLQPYRVRLQLIRIDFWKVIMLLSGLLIFSFAADLSTNPLFYYITGVLVGIFASFIVLIYLMGKLVPKRPMMYGVLIGGWTIGIYIVQLLWENVQIILSAYQVYVFWYVCITGVISFIICYRFGPPKNQRSKDLIKWSLQLASIILIFFSSEFEEAVTALILLTIIFYYFPRSWLKIIKFFLLRRFPQKPKLLTNEEYVDQGIKETAKALAELRNYCSSPECKQWKVITKLKDPLRFASFVEGSSHLKDDEIFEYETKQYSSDSESSAETNNFIDEDSSEYKDDRISRKTLNANRPIHIKQNIFQKN